MDVAQYQVGKLYRIPHVNAWLAGIKSLWPVIGPWHDDVEVIGFKEKHYHIDARFLTERQFKHVTSTAHEKLAPFALIIVENRYSPVGEIEQRLRKCRREYDDYPRKKAHWITKLEATFANKTIDSRLICPHRGASLRGLKPDSKGCVTCPLHGLRWDCNTGRLSPPNASNQLATKGGEK